MEKFASNLDRADVAILRALQRDGRMTNAELAKAATMSESSCLRRVKSLETSGIIEGYAAVIDQRAVGLPLSVFVTISLISQADTTLKEFEQQVGAVPEVLECYLLTGGSDYLLRIAARDVDDLERIHSTRLTKLAHVARITSSIALRQVVRQKELPIITTS